MTATVAQGRDEILTAFRIAWLAGPPSNTLPVLYPGTKLDPPSSGSWARVTVRHEDGFQATLSDHGGRRRFRRVGTVTVQLFTPDGDGQTLSDTLVAIVKGAFEGKSTPRSVIFRDVRVQEIGIDGIWFNCNVQADFEYDEVL